MALNRSDKSRILRRYFPGMTRNSEMSTELSKGAPGHFFVRAVGWSPMYQAILRLPMFRWFPVSPR